MFILRVFFMQVEPWLTTYRSAVTLCWTRTPSFTSLYRSCSPCTTSTTNLSCTEILRHRIFFWTSTRWSSKLATLAFPRSLSARAKLTRWVDLLLVWSCNYFSHTHFLICRVLTQINASSFSLCRWLGRHATSLLSCVKESRITRRVISGLWAVCSMSWRALKEPSRLLYVSYKNPSRTWM